MILALDVTLRLLVIEARTTKGRYNHPDTHQPTSDELSEAEPCEEDSLLPRADAEEYKIHGEVGGLTRAVPILYCFHDRRFMTAFVLTMIQSSFRGIFDATVPVEAQAVFHFSSQKVGLLFITLFVPHLALAHIVGSTVDRLGTRVVSTVGFAFLVPCLALLGLPSQKLITGDSNVILFCIILALNGAGISIVSTPAFVEAIHVTRKYEASNPGFFGEHGPYAQLYGFNCMFFSAGLTIGPIAGGLLREYFGYEVVGFVFAILSAVAAVLSFVVIGERTR